MKRCLQIVAICLLGLGALPRVTQACDCAVPPPSPLNQRMAREAAASAAIFLGQVLEVTSDHVVFKVLEPYKGDLGDQIALPAGPSDCDYIGEWMKPGDNHLIYVKTFKEKIKVYEVRVSICGGSGTASRRADEIEYLRKQNSLTPAPTP